VKCFKKIKAIYHACTPKPLGKLGENGGFYPRNTGAGIEIYCGLENGRKFLH